MDIYPPTKQRPALLDLTRALGARDSALCRDACGDWHIAGTKGQVYAVPGGYQVFVMGWTAIGWNSAKRALSLAKLTNDGETEGSFILARLPLPVEAVAIRHWCGIPKKREVSAEELTRLRTVGFVRAA